MSNRRFGDAGLYRQNSPIYVDLRACDVGRLTSEARNRDGVRHLVNCASFQCAGREKIVEVHISNIAKRNIHCVLSDIAEGMITGFGMHSYILGLDAMLEILRKRIG